MPRVQHKYHFIYKTTNLKNGKFYIGMHSTSNLDDGYLGSGDKLRRSIRKYGKENFKLEILEYFENRELLSKREKELINEDVLKDPMCMNLKVGGEGGWHVYANKAFKEKLKDIKYKENFSRICIERNKKCFELGIIKSWNKTYDWTDKYHTPETIKKMKNSKIGHGKGELNSQFGTFWITDGKYNKKTKYEIPEGWYKGRV